jgi:hypothetical protein
MPQTLVDSIKISPGSGRLLELGNRGILNGSYEEFIVGSRKAEAPANY